jgi:hypothetical protein
VENAGDWTDPGIGYRWIKANVYGALAIAVLGLVASAFRTMAVNDGDIGVAATSLFLAAATFTTALGLAVWARLTGGTLARRLPGFPVRAWILLHALIGLADGVFDATSEIGVVTIEPDPDAILGTALTVMVFWTLLWAAVGSLQALVLRKVARGVRRWIGYSALAGLVMSPIVLAALYWPQAGWRGEFWGELGAAIVTVIIAIILLPALWRLEPRAATASAGAVS